MSQLEIGMIGLGRMGGGLALKALREGVKVVGIDINPPDKKFLDAGLIPIQDYAGFVKNLKAPRIIFVYIPSGPMIDTTVEKLQKVLGTKVLGIEHVGSTAIKGIKAKPILDLMVGVKMFGEPKEYSSDLEKLDYIFRNDFRENQGHILFVKGPEENRTHYLKVCAFNSDFWKEHVIFRDFLNANPQYANEYENLKETLLEEHSRDRVPYTAGKKVFVEKILKLAGYTGKVL